MSGIGLELTFAGPARLPQSCHSPCRAATGGFHPELTSRRETGRPKLDVDKTDNVDDYAAHGREGMAPPAVQVYREKLAKNTELRRKCERDGLTLGSRVGGRLPTMG